MAFSVRLFNKIDKVCSVFKIRRTCFSRVSTNDDILSVGPSGPIYTVRLCRMRQAYGRLTTVVYVTKNVVGF